MIKNFTAENTAQRTALQPVEPKRKPVGTARVPSQVMPALRRMIIGSFLAGRSVKQIADEFQVTATLALELVIRAEMESRRAEMERTYQPARLRAA